MSSQLAEASRGSSSEVLQARINTLLKLEESRLKYKERFKHQQEIVKIWFDKHKFGKGIFEVGYLVLKWDHPHDEKEKHTKFQHLWIGPFQIAEKLGSSQCISYRIYRGGKRIFLSMVWFSNLTFPSSLEVICT